MNEGNWVKPERGYIQAIAENPALLWSTTKEQWKENQKAVLATV